MSHPEDLNAEPPLEPGEADAHRIVPIDRFLIQLRSSGNPSFVRQGQAFIDAPEPGDILVEFCTSKKSWQECQGACGYLVERQGKTVAELISRFN
jgi:hypothetical protein